MKAVVSKTWLVLGLLVALLLCGPVQASDYIPDGLKGINQFVVSCTLDVNGILDQKSTEDYLTGIMYASLRAKLPQAVGVSKAYANLDLATCANLYANVLLDKRPGGGYYGVVKVDVIRPLYLPDLTTQCVATVYESCMIVTSGRLGDAKDQLRSVTEELTQNLINDFYDARPDP